ncbi:beta-galactosidase [Demequina sp. SYSU T00192]|uniref:Beta-galactosidase n=1 Tax=Demequina litoralis TaxID=3051660 RepID=A0ABT8G6H3_9MICO|nr:beta-galactosidase [Demequina sp. SYSU T00192]MDN4474748.1 beta-galactosidase [Demequina sp. SYSU T00192]
MSTGVDPHPAVTSPYAVRVTAPAPLAPAPLDLGDPAGTPDGIRVTTRCLERDGVPWIPVMGEYHYARDLPERWERELRKMRAGGVDVVAAYIIWILHEEVEGDIRWDGARDLRRFVETAHRVGLKVMLRIGPWVHAETRNGGLPDWLQAQPIGHRTDDPGYLEPVRRWIGAIADQTRDLLHGPDSPAAPVIGIQVENEIYDQPQHIATLRRIAEDAGLRASLWTATGWGGAQLPAGAVLPVYAGYPDGFWEEADVDWPAFGIMHFTFNEERDDLTVGADLRDEAAQVGDDAALGAGDPWPYATCELGGGMTVAYHRRPHVDSADVAALGLTKLGSGSSWQGYYMYHGGTHVIGALSTTQESHETDYPNDVPVLDYDFYAPLGAHGQERPHFHMLRRQHLFLDAFGDRLAPLPATIPPQVDGGPRWSVRTDGARGFLFLNNHQPAVAALPELEDVRFEVQGDDAVLTVPTAPIRIPAGATAIWPLRQPLGSIPAVTATVQPVTEIGVGARTVVLLAVADGIEAELQLEGVSASAVSGASVRSQGDVLIVRPDTEPGPDCVVSVGDTDLVLLTSAQADSVWRGEVAGRDTVLLWDGEAWFDEGFTVVAPEAVDELLALPALAAPTLGQVGPFACHRVDAASARHVVELPEAPVAVTAPRRLGGSAHRLSAPTDADFAALDAVAVPVDDAWFEDAEQLILELDWTGDALRLYAGGALIADQFWSGRPLEIDLLPHRAAIAAGGLALRAFAWNPKAGVHVDRRVRPDTEVPLLRLRSAQVRPVVTRTLA